MIPSNIKTQAFWRIDSVEHGFFFAEQSPIGKSWRKGNNFCSRKTCLWCETGQLIFRGYQLQNSKSGNLGWRKQHRTEKSENSSRIIERGAVFPIWPSWSTRVWKHSRSIGGFHTNLLIWRLKTAKLFCWILSAWKMKLLIQLKATGKVGGGLGIKKADSFWTISFATDLLSRQANSSQMGQELRFNSNPAPHLESEKLDENGTFYDFMINAAPITTPITIWPVSFKNQGSFCE